MNLLCLCTLNDEFVNFLHVLESIPCLTFTSFLVDIHTPQAVKIVSLLIFKTYNNVLFKVSMPTINAAFKLYFKTLVQKQLADAYLSG